MNGCGLNGTATRPGEPKQLNEGIRHRAGQIGVVATSGERSWVVEGGLRVAKKKKKNPRCQQKKKLEATFFWNSCPTKPRGWFRSSLYVAICSQGTVASLVWSICCSTFEVSATCTASQAKIAKTEPLISMKSAASRPFAGVTAL